MYLRNAAYATVICLSAQVFAESGPGGVGSDDGTSSLALWLKADSGVFETDGKVSMWADYSGNSRHATQASPDTQPTLEAHAFNGRPAVRFDGVDDSMSVDLSFLVGSEYTIFAIERRSETNENPGAPNYFLSTNQQDQNRGFNLGYPFPTAFRVAHWSNDLQVFYITQDNNPRPTMTTTRYSFSVNAGQLLRIDGERRADRYPVVAMSQANGGRLGGGTLPAWVYAGDIAELIVFTEALDNAGIVFVENYLSTKYHTPLAPIGIDVFDGDSVEKGEYDTDFVAIGVVEGAAKSGVQGSGLSLTNGGIIAGELDTVAAAHKSPTVTETSANIDATDNLNVRWSRDWYLDVKVQARGAGTLTVGFDPAVADMPLPADETIYHLLYRAELGSNYSVLQSATLTAPSSIDFDVAGATSGYYTLGFFRTSAGAQYIRIK